jgi:hypothetical protein
VYTGLRHRPAE